MSHLQIKTDGIHRPSSHHVIEMDNGVFAEFYRDIRDVQHTDPGKSYTVVWIDGHVCSLHLADGVGLVVKKDITPII